MSISVFQHVLIKIIHVPWKFATAVVELWNYTKAGKRLKTAEYTIESDHLPEAFDQFRIVQLSDLHGRCFGSHQEKLLSLIQSLEPDLVICTGDMYEEVDHKHFSRIHDLMKGLGETWPTYAILGNHEIKLDYLDVVIPDMKACGVRLLRDQAAILKKEGAVIGLAGIDTDIEGDAFFREDDQALSKRLTKTLSRYQDEAVPFTVLLAHKPEMLDIYSRFDVDVVYSGHAHGGLMKVPLIHKRLLAPGQGIFPRYTEGVYASGRTRMVLSTGLGGPRLKIQPEVVCTTLKCKPK